MDPFSPPSKWQNLWKWGSIFLATAFILIFSNALLALVYKNFEWQAGPVSQAFYFLLTALIINICRSLNERLDREMPWEDGLAQRFFLQLFLNLSISLFVVSILRNRILLTVAGVDREFRFIRVQDEILINLVFAGFVLAVILVDLGIILMKKWKETATEAERVKKENMEFRFDRLRNQINPHFLFNSLNTLASLVYQNPETASQFIRQLARVYRYVLENRDKEIITLAEEWEFMESYLFLVKIRFDDGLRFELDLPSEHLNRYIAPMTLQLLVENALKHNIVSSSKPLVLQIKIENEQLVVENNLQPKLQPEPSTHTGLENIRSRYAMLSSRPIQVIMTEKTFRVEIPLLQIENTNQIRP